MVKIQVVNRGHQQLPAYATPQSAGMDLRANLSEPITLRPLERRLIPTGCQTLCSMKKLSQRRQVPKGRLGSCVALPRS